MVVVNRKYNPQVIPMDCCVVVNLATVCLFIHIVHILIASV